MTASNAKASLEIREISLDWDEIDEANKLIKHEGEFVCLNMSPGTTMNIINKTAQFRIMNCATRKIEKVPINYIDKILDGMRTKQFLETEQRDLPPWRCSLKRKKWQRIHSMGSIKKESRCLFMMYMSRRVARIRVGTIKPDVKPEWVIVTIVN